MGESTTVNLHGVLNKLLDNKPHVWRTSYIVDTEHIVVTILRAPGENGRGVQMLARMTTFKNVYQIGGAGVIEYNELYTWLGLNKIKAEVYFKEDTVANIAQLPGPLNADDLLKLARSKAN